MSQAQPLLSVVIPNFNRGPYLERCLRSIFDEIDRASIAAEVIVIDGRSTDNSVEVLKAHQDRLAYWVSEPDRGVSDAVNKGLAKARGEIVHMIGSDDEVLPGAYRAARD